ncbi:MAG: SagB/ThcOx family dehydrogenase [Bacteroidales bacterium]|nr:SagB/ThcOx family dehydrogenase [Bacteroidales bacterium]
MRRIILTICITASVFSASAQSVINLPAPVTTGGKPLMDVLSERHSGREFLDSAMSDQQISNLLWAAYGVNRSESGKRTAPSARNMQEFDIYVALKKGLYRWNSANNQLEPIKSGDFRGRIGRQTFVASASLVLIFVADYDRMGKMEEASKEFYSAADCGYISQNVYLFAASENLSTVVLGSVERESVAQLLGLKTTQKIVFAQPVGFSKPE